MITFFKDEDKRQMLFVIVSGITLIVSFIFGKNWTFDPAWIAIILCGIPIIKEAAVALVTKFDVKADLLVSMALIAAVIIGEIFAAGEVAFIMTLGAMLEDRTVAKARAGIEKLIQLTPRNARVIRDGKETMILAEEVRTGDTLRVLAGETIPVDGIITSGQTSIDQSVMTGESLPVDKTEGDDVASGTVNQFGTFDMNATKVGEDSSLQRMIRLVESADADKAKIVGLADRWATWIVVIALVSAAGTWIVTGEIIRAVTILVVFCPCALVLATPTAIMAGIGNATKFGILIREGDALERLARVTDITFDKTGTLTYGTLTISSVENFKDNMAPKELLTIVAAAEKKSEHPLGKAVTSYYKNEYGAFPQDPEAFTLIAGRGVDATVNGSRVLVGNGELFVAENIEIPPSENIKAGEHQNEGCTVVFVSIDSEYVGMIALTDTLRADSEEVIQDIKNIGIETILLTGDNKHAAQHIAAETGINNIRYDCLPETKLQTIAEMENNGKRICMVGDGVNDAPALKKAFVGIAMGGIGSDIAIDAADIALVGDDIKYLPHLLRLAKRTMGKIKFNLSASMVLNFVAIILAMLGIMGPVVGALVHNVGSVLVIINSSLLLGYGMKDKKNQVGAPH